MLICAVYHKKRIALMHRILTTLVPLSYLCLLHGKCRLSQKSLISVLELKSLVLVRSFLVLESLVLEPRVFVIIPANQNYLETASS